MLRYALFVLGVLAFWGYVAQTRDARTDIVLAGDPVTWLITSAIMLGASFALQAQARSRSFLVDDEPGTTATIGDQAFQSFGGASAIGPTVMYVDKDQAVHMIALGPPDVTVTQNKSEPRVVLRQVIEEGKIVFDGRIDANHGAGVPIPLVRTKGTLRFFFGEIDQPADPKISSLLAADMSADVAFPGQVYAHWEGKGTNGRWPNIVYVLEIRPTGANIEAMRPLLNANVSRWHDETFDTKDIEFWVLDLDVGEGYVDAWVCRTDSTRPPNTCATNHLNGWIEGSPIEGLEPGQEVIFSGMASGNGIGYRIARATTLFAGRTFYDPRFPFDKFIVTGLTRIYLGDAIGLSMGDPTQRWQFEQWGRGRVQRSNEDYGANVAYCIDDLVFASEPNGVGFPAEHVHLPSLAALANHFEFRSGGTDALLAHVGHDDGATALDTLIKVLQDLGVVFTIDPSIGKYVFRIIRPPTDIDAVPILEGVHLSGEMPEQSTVVESPNDAEEIAFEFEEATRRFRKQTILVPNDGAAEYTDRRDVKKVGILIAKDFRTAEKVAGRRVSEGDAEGVSKIRGQLAARALPSGTFVRVEGDDEVYQIIENEPEYSGGATSLSVTPVFYDSDVTSLPSGLSENAGNGGNTFGVFATLGLQSEASLSGAWPDPGEAGDRIIGDHAHTPIELPRLVAPDSVEVFVARVRRDVKSGAAELFYGEHGAIEDHQLPEEYFAEFFRSIGMREGGIVGGVLRSRMEGDSASEGQTIDVTLFGPDVERIAEHDDPEWRAGLQVLWVGGEWCFLRTVERVDATTWKARGVLRGRHATAITPHEIGSRVFIWQAGSEQPVRAQLGYVVATSIPDGIRERDTVDRLPFDREFVSGLGLRPLGPRNLRTEFLGAHYEQGQGLDLRWSYVAGRARMAGQGAGYVPSGSSYLAMPPDGNFVVELRDGLGFLVDRFVLTPDDAVAYGVPGLAGFRLSSAELTVTFGVEPVVIRAKVWEELHGFASEAEELIIDQVA